MRPTPLLLVPALVAVAFCRAQAQDEPRKKDAPGIAGQFKGSPEVVFKRLDRNNDGWLSRSEAMKNSYLRKNFKAADKDHDGKLSRTEYLEAMTKKDMASLKNKVTGNKEQNAATGSSRAK